MGENQNNLQKEGEENVLPPRWKAGIIGSVRASNVDEAVEIFKQKLLEAEKDIPEGVPHTVWVPSIYCEWDYFN